MTIDTMRRRFNIPTEWPRSLIESESAYIHRLIATGVRYGVGAWCATDKHEACADAPVPAASCRCYCHATQSKRFTDAELAAEYWRASSGVDEVNYDRLFDTGSINGIIHRFATLPHHDQETS